MPYIKKEIATILFWKERHYDAIQSFQASKNKRAANPIRHARETLASFMKTIKMKAGHLQRMRDKAFDKSMSTADEYEEIANKFQSEAQVH